MVSNPSLKPPLMIRFWQARAFQTPLNQWLHLKSEMTPVDPQLERSYLTLARLVTFSRLEVFARPDDFDF